MIITVHCGNRQIERADSRHEVDETSVYCADRRREQTADTKLMIISVHCGSRQTERQSKDKDTTKVERTNVVENKLVKASGKFTDSGLELKEVTNKTIKFNGLTDTGANLSLPRKSVFVKLGIKSLTGYSKTLTGIGESHVMTFGSFTISVKIKDIEMKDEFHIVPDEDIAYETVLGRTILDHVDLVVTNESTKLVSIKQKESLYKANGSCAELFNEIESMCILSAEQNKVEIKSDLSHPSAEIASEVRQLIESYKPIRNTSTPIEMNIALTDELPVYQHPKRLAEFEQKIVEAQLSDEWTKLVRNLVHEKGYEDFDIENEM